MHGWLLKGKKSWIWFKNLCPCKCDEEFVICNKKSWTLIHAYVWGKLTINPIILVIGTNDDVTFDNLKQVLVIYMGPSDEYITTKFITFGVIVSRGMQIGLG